MGFFNKDNSPESQAARQELKDMKAAMRQERREERAEARQAARDAREQAMADRAAVLITTGDLNAQYEIIDCIFAVDSKKESFFLGRLDPDAAFMGVKDYLRTKCYQLGGQAVINCQFQYRDSLDHKGKQIIEIFAYGTAVRLR